ncbi:MAG: ABC transporter permease [Roseburia sp.]
MKHKDILNRIILLVIALLLMLPLIITFIYSLFTEWTDILPKGFTLDGYSELFADPLFWMSMLRTVVISLIPIAITTLIMLLAMYVIVIYLPGLEKIIQTLCTIPYALQGVILPISIIALYSAAPEPFSNRIFMLVSAYSIVVLPYIYQGIRNNLHAVSAPKLIEAAQMLGASRFYAFFRIVVPNIMNGITVSAMLAMAIVFGDFTIINTLAGNYFPTSQMYLFETTKSSSHKASAIIIVLFVVTLLISGCVFLMNKDKKKRKDD